MVKGSFDIEVKASCEVVFDILHDYPLRLRWDTMLSEARLLNGAVQAGKGVHTRCVGTWRSAYLALETDYVAFRRGELAAVRLTNRPPLFERFAASIRHSGLPDGTSRVIYTYSFVARPKLAARLIEPMMSRLIAREVRLRLVALKGFIEREGLDIFHAGAISRISHEKDTHFHGHDPGTAATRVGEDAR